MEYTFLKIAGLDVYKIVIESRKSHYRGITWQYYDQEGKTWRQGFRSYKAAENDARRRGYIATYNLI